MQNLKKYFWDYNFTEEELNKLLSGKINSIGHLSSESLYSRILTSGKWYQILETIGTENLEKALSEKVLKSIKSNELKRKLRIARGILFK